MIKCRYDINEEDSYSNLLNNACSFASTSTHTPSLRRYVGTEITFEIYSTVCAYSVILQRHINCSCHVSSNKMIG